ncbi:hypothetical protein KP509_13G051600 [Ceratopteris richardii]|uniref:Thioredoxin domain-containing protein n=1 Tax=Ceratopteris richardii TaxID=49495 RepID=A0A8T2THT1_CERRI|nr:hypothetical protein KP509_13G051600 [Ceratopteris richardii]
MAMNLCCPGVRPVHVRAVSSSSASTSPYSATKETSYASKEFQALSSITIFSTDGSPVKFQDLWNLTNGKAVVAFLRHFGCPLCWEFAASLRDAKPKFDSAGVTLVVIGVGTPENARTMAERLPFSKEVLYADPGREAYKALDFYYGVGRTFFNPASAKVLGRFDTIRTALKDYTIDATPKDRSSVLQQGGLLVFKGTQLLFSRKDEGTGDHASLDDVLKIVS